MYLDTCLQFQTNKNISLKKASHAQDRVRRLELTYGLEPGLIGMVQVAAFQVVTIYGAERWWHGQKGYCEEFQGMVNRQEWAVTSMFRTIPRVALVR